MNKRPKKSAQETAPKEHPLIAFVLMIILFLIFAYAITPQNKIKTDGPIFMHLRKV